MSSAPPMHDSVSVRHYLTEALRLDLIGPWPGDDTLQRERLPQAPSLWYMTGLLAPTGAPDAQRGQDVGEELDDPAEPMQGGDDSNTPERGSGKRVLLPSSMGLSILVDTEARHLAVTVSWGDYTPDRENDDDETEVSEEEPEGDAAASGRYRYKPWERHSSRGTRARRSFQGRHRGPDSGRRTEQQRSEARLSRSRDDNQNGRRFARCSGCFAVRREPALAGRGRRPSGYRFRLSGRDERRGGPASGPEVRSQGAGRATTGTSGLPIYTTAMSPTSRSATTYPRARM